MSLSERGKARISRYVTPLAVAAGIYMLFLLAALYHQHRALEAAREARRKNVPVMIEMRHLARCVSFSMPFFRSATEECFLRGREIIGLLDAEGDKEGARTARSALFGAIESSFWESENLAEAKRRLGAAAAPAGAHPLSLRTVLPPEPATYAGVMAGGLLFLMMIFFFAVRPLTGGRPEGSWKAWAAAGAALLVLYVLCLL